MTARLILYGILAVVMGVSWASTCVIWRAAELGEMVAPLDVRDFGELKVVVLGSGGGYENPERLGPSIAIGWDQNALLVDAGRGVAESLRRAKIPLAQPDTILLSNLLPENTVGIDDLLLTGWRQPRTKPLRLIGPPGTAALAAGIMAAHDIGAQAEMEGRGLPLPGAKIDAIEVDPGEGLLLERNGLVVRAVALPGRPVTALAWSFERGGRRAVVATTGWSPEAIVAFSKGADLLVHEAVIIPEADGAEKAGILIDPELLRREAALHTAIVDVGGMAQRAGVKKLALVRMRPPPFYQFQAKGVVAQTYDGEVVVPEDGEEIEW